MPDGKYHHQVWRRNWKWVPPLMLLSYKLTDFIMQDSVGAVVSVGVMAGYAMGRFIDPDLDEMGTTASEGRMVNEIPILGHFMFGHWSTYGSIFRKHHRSFWTHFPVVSTLIRIIYQFYGIFLILFLKNWMFPWIIYLFLGIWIGLSFADFLHWKEDVKSKEIRRRK